MPIRLRQPSGLFIGDIPRLVSMGNVTLAAAARGTIITSLSTGYDSNVDQSSYTTTESISVAAGALSLMFIQQTAASANGPTSFSGAYSGNWVEVVSRANAAPSKLSCYRAMSSSPVSGQITVNFDSGDATTGVHIFAVKCLNTDISGANGSGAIADTFSDQLGSASSINFSMPNFEHSSNIMVYCVSVSVGGTIPFNAGPNFTLLSELSHNSPNRGAMVAAGAAGVNTASPSWSASGNAVWVAVQVKSSS